METLFDIKGTVVITGAAGLLGEQHARAVLNNGGSVALIDINQNNLQTLKENLEKEGFNKVDIFVCDITKKHDVENILEEIEKKDNQIVGLVNNAAINPIMDKTLNS